MSGENRLQYYIPEGFAHGFVVLSDRAIFSYKVTDFYHPNDEGGILWNDEDLGIDWPMPEGMTAEELILSDKDRRNPTFREYQEMEFH